MILTALIGNTNTRLTWFRGTAIVKRWMRPTGTALPAVGRIDGTAVASVMPARTTPVIRGLKRQTGASPLVVTPATKTGLKFRYDRRQLGADRVCAAVGAHLRYPGDLVVLDFGTAITLNVISADGTFKGGAIMPGADMMFEALARSTAQLPRVRLATGHDRNPPRVSDRVPIPMSGPQSLGHDTKSAIQTGVTGLLSGGIESLIDRLGPGYRVIATGGRAPMFRKLIRRIDAVDPDLAARGLAEILCLNQTRPRVTTRKRT
jgi:type III pantothenate kinase